jgi:hypothetical protein
MITKGHGLPLNLPKSDISGHTTQGFQIVFE